MEPTLTQEIINSLAPKSGLDHYLTPPIPQVDDSVLQNRTDISKFFSPPDANPDRLELHDVREAYEKLLPQNREKDLDIFGLKKRSGPNQTRTKGDKASSILSIIAEGLGAALGGNKYKNPYVRAHEQFNEDFKLQAPRLMDQERILSQNIRASEALEAAEKKNAAREALDRDKMALQMRLAQIRSNTALSVAQKKAETQKELAEFAVRYPKDQELARWAAVQGKDIFELRDDPEAMSKAMAGINANKILPFAARSLFAPTKSIQSVPYSREQTNEFGEIQTLHGTKPMAVSGPNSAAQNFILQSLVPGSQIDYSLLPGSQSPQQPTAPANAAPDVFSPPPTPKARPLAQPQASPLLRNTPTIPASIEETKPSPIVDTIPQELAKSSHPGVSTYARLASFDAYPIWGYNGSDFKLHFTQDGGMAYTGADGAPQIIAAPRFRKGETKEKERFEQTRKAVYDMNTLARLVAIQYVKKDGNLYTGKLGFLNADATQSSVREQRPGVTQKIAKAFSKSAFGRVPDDIDATISRLANTDILDKILQFTGKASNISERDTIKKVSANISQNPDAFLDTVLRLAVEANRKYLDEYKKAIHKQNGNVVFSDTSIASTAGVMEKVEEIKRNIQGARAGRNGLRMGLFNVLTQTDAKEIQEALSKRRK